MVKKVREGYKMTELGEIPEEWEVKKLNEVTKLIKDGTHNPPPRTENGIPLLSAENIFNNRVKFGLNEKNISIKSYEDMHKNYVIENGDVLMTIVGTIGRTAVVKSESKFTVQRSVAIFKVKDEIEPFYFNYCLNSHYFQKQLKIRANTTAQSGIYLGELSKMSLGIPSNREQQKIASILSSVDEQIEITDNLIEKTKELKKGLMQKLLTKGIGHEKFKDTEIGRIPEEWELKKLGEICEIKSSKRVYQSDYTDGGIPFYRSKEIIELSKRRAPQIELYISEDMYSKFENKYGAPTKGDLLITSVGTIGKTWISDGRKFYYKDGNITQIINNSSINIDFISYLFDADTLKKQYLGQSSGSAQVALTIEKLNKLTIPFPKLKEQQKIASILFSVDNQIEEYQTKKEKLENLKKGLMQKLLTGKIRVKI